MIDNELYTLTITNLIESGAAFGIKHGTGDTCYIPASVAFTSGLQAGDVVKAALVPNPNELARDRTPFMARYVAPQPAESAAGGDAPIDFIRDTLKNGGVWTSETMFVHFKEHKTDAITVDTARRALDTLFNEGACARFTMVKGPRQLTPSREWFTAYPELADVDEYDEVTQDDFNDALGNKI